MSKHVLRRARKRKATVFHLHKRKLFFLSSALNNE